MNLDDLNKIVQVGKSLLKGSGNLQQNDHVGRLSGEFFQLVKNIESNVDKANKVISDLNNLKDDVFKNISEQQVQLTKIVNKLSTLNTEAQNK